ncbi:hypothetical protein EXIGLDRAFT_716698 [Exidia glandulosa HHB12029]|uniref:BZIP domain-containing protein n=1 Tax=Exidia glandulosa HHB12029 TaxID=1314781 RepID=A0A165ITM9_EXIGL|nr:hypothetical protein EXIGLDRAFT_716698 [Exidia glandulosa HHB12029]
MSSYSERVRNNQKRSRQRKKDYIASLEARVRACEQDGVQASVELQRTARRVDRENRILRRLLHEHGVVDDVANKALAAEDASTSTSSVTGDAKCCSDSTSCARLAAASGGDIHSLPVLSPSSEHTSTLITSLGQHPPSSADVASLDGLSSSASNSAGPTFSLSSSTFCCPSPLSAADSEVDVDALFCNVYCFPRGVVDPTSDRYTPCRLAFAFLKSLNRSRGLQMDLFDGAFAALWLGCKADAQRECVLQDEALFNAARLLLLS